MTNSTKRTFLIAGIVLLGIASRFIPHIANFTPLAAIALFAGAYFTSGKRALLIPMTILLLSDFGMQAAHWLGFSEYPGFYPGMIFVYGAFFAVGLIGRLLKGRVRPLPVSGAAIGGTLVFFLISNFGVWLSSGMYPLTISGLGECYVMALPFARASLISDVLFSLLIFGAFEWWQASVDVRSRRAAFVRSEEVLDHQL